MRKLRGTLAHNRKRARDAVAALRARVAPSAPPEATAAAAAATSGRFRSLRALAGRTIPLDQPTSFTFLNEPFSFVQSSDVPVGVSVSLAPGDVFFRASVNQNNQGYLTDLTDFGFVYLWNNDSDSAMLVNVVTTLELYGDLTVSVQNADFLGFPFIYYSTRSRVGGRLSLGSLEDPFMESSQQSIFADVHVSTFTMGDEKDWFFSNEHYGLSFDNFLVAPISTLVITVWTEFRTDFNFDDDGSGDYGIFDFFTFPDLFRIACPGVAVIASPVAGVI